MGIIALGVVSDFRLCEGCGHRQEGTNKKIKRNGRRMPQYGICSGWIWIWL
jgi:hypothetical protein